MKREMTVAQLKGVVEGLEGRLGRLEAAVLSSASGKSDEAPAGFWARLLRLSE